MSSKKYEMTLHGVMHWAKSELKHVGNLAGVKDRDVQYAYAQSVVNGMLHLRDALFELVNDPAYSQNKTELLRTHDKVVRVVKHVIKDYNVKLSEIKKFNTHRVLGKLNYLRGGSSKSRKNRNKKNYTRKNSH
jgi:hypothetical protein